MNAEIIEKVKKIPGHKDKKLHYISTDDIAPNPLQPRVDFDEAALGALAESIMQHGFLQPIIVRHRPRRDSRGPETSGPNISGTKYELVSGERRFRAARRLGLRSVPCVIVEGDSRTSALMALSENLIREDLNVFEEAAALYNALLLTGVTQTTLAKQLSMSQSAIANKIRLLRLSATERQLILDNSLTERHARTLLRIDDEPGRRSLIDAFVQKSLSAAQAEREVEEYLYKKDIAKVSLVYEKKQPKRISLIKDVNFFINSVNNAIDLISESGIEVKKQTKDLGEYIEIVLNVKKN